MGRLTHTVSGSIATVRSPAVAPIESLKVYFSPIQEGTGDPSPSNVRPITGWTGVTGYKSGKNLAHVVGYSASVVNSPNEQRSESNSYGTSLNTVDYIGTDGRVVITQTQAPATDIKTRYANGFIYIIFDNLEFDRYYDVQFKITDITSNPLNVSLNEISLLSPYGTSASVSEVKTDGTVIFKNALLNHNSIAINRQHFEIRICGLSFTLSNFMIRPADAKYEDFEPYSGETIPATFPNFSANLFDSLNETFGRITKSGDIYSNSDTDDRTNVQLQIQLYNDTTLLSTLNPYDFTETGIISFDFSIDNSLCNRICFKHNGVTKDFRIFFPFIYGMGTYTISCNIISNDPTTIGGLQLSDIFIKRGNENFIDYVNNKVYGGYIDLSTGTIVSTYVKAILDESISDSWWGINSYPDLGINRFVLSRSWFKYRPKNGTNNVFINYCIARNHQLPWRGFIGSTGNALFYAPDDEVPDKSSWMAYLSEHNLEICYEMETPTVVATLTPQELATFKGYSNFWSNAGDVDVTYQVVESSEMTKERQKIFAGNAPTIHTASGSVANFNMEPGLNRNLKSCKVGFLPVQEGSGDPFPPINQNGSIVGVDNVHNESELSSFKIHFSPIQSGSGDPSPTNSRPITGWTGVTGYKGEKNLLDPSTNYTANHYESQGITFDLNSDGSVTINGTVVEGASTSPQFAFLWTQPITGNYYFCANIPYSGGYNEIYMYDNTVGARCKQWDGVSNGLSSHSARPLCEAQLIAGHRISLVIRITRDTGFTYDNVKCSPMLMASNCTDTTFEPYSAPTSYPVSWESQGTIHGGYVDLVSGDVVKTCEIVDDLSTLYWSDNGPINNYNIHEYLSTDLVNVIARTSSSDDQHCIACSKYKAIDRTTQYGNRIINTIASTTGGQIRIYSEGVSTYSTVQEFKESLSGVSLVYQLATPVIVTTLTPTQIALATGKSSYWSNADSVTVETAGNVRPINGWSWINTRNYNNNELNITANNLTQRSGMNYTVLKDENNIKRGVLVEGQRTTNNAFFNFNYVDATTLAIAPGSYKVDGYTQGIIDFRVFIKNSQSVEECVFNSRNGNTNVFTIPSDAQASWIRIQVETSDYVCAYVYPVLVKYDAELNSYPITFPVQGKNLFNSSFVNGNVDITSGSISKVASSYPNRLVSDFIKLSAGTYTFSVKENKEVTVYFYSTDNQSSYIEAEKISNWVSCPRSFTIANERYAIFVLRNSNNSNLTSNDVTEIQLEQGSSKTAYEPYDNSIFGGYVNLVTGEVWKTHICETANDKGWLITASGAGQSGHSKGTITNALPDGSESICTHWKNISSNQEDINKINHNNYFWLCRKFLNSIGLYGSEITAENINRYLESQAKNGTPVYISSPLETPVLVTTLTPTQIQALKGTNNILSDANGTIEVKYWSH